MASETNTRSFYGLIRPLFLFFFMVLISNKEQDIDKTWQNICSFCFIYSHRVYNRVFITKKALTELLRNTLDKSLKLKNMLDERLGCPTKSLLSQDFYRTMSDLLKTLIWTLLSQMFLFLFLNSLFGVAL